MQKHAQNWLNMPVEIKTHLEITWLTGSHLICLVLIQPGANPCPKDIETERNEHHSDTDEGK